jgi:hypothetical protein
MNKARSAAVCGFIAVTVAAISAANSLRSEPARGIGVVPHGVVFASSRTATASATTASVGPNIGQGTFDGESPAVSSLPVLPVPPLTTLVARDNESLHPNAQPSGAKDPVVQSKKGTGPISAPLQSFDGMCLPDSTCDQRSYCGCLPPDPNGDIGTNQYVQMVNEAFAVYSKNGALLRPATDINQLWAGSASECAIHNEGDPVVLYDQLAKRWLLSQFISDPNTGEQYGECIAVSTSNDATGSYFRYTFLFGAGVFYDYPKIGVWPDGQRVPGRAADVERRRRVRLRTRPDARREGRPLRLLRRIGGQPARRPVRRPAPGRSGWKLIASERRAESGRRGRRPNQRPPDDGG